MNQKVVNGVINALKDSISYLDDSNVMFSNTDYETVDFSDDHFFKIMPDETSRSVCFVDGGNLEILKAPNFSLQFMRIASIIYKNTDIIKKQVREYYILVTSVKKEGEIHYKTDIFPFKSSSEAGSWKFIFNSKDKQIEQSNFRASISSIGGIVRNLFEIKEAEDMISNLSKGDILVRDGNLQATNNLEMQFFDSLYSKAADKSVVVCGLSKTSDLFTDTGNSASAYFSNRANSLGLQEPWYYFPLVNISSAFHKADIYFTKLHPSASHVFRLDVVGGTNREIVNGAVDVLVSQSTDPVFLGYPYGLINVDRLARVQFKEAEFIKTMIMSKLGKEWKKLEPNLNSMNSHSILDNIG